MKAFKLFAIAGLLTAFCSAPGAKADEMSGREIMDKVKELQTTQDEKESQEMQLIDSKYWWTFSIRGCLAVVFGINGLLSILFNVIIYIQAEVTK